MGEYTSLRIYYLTSRKLSSDYISIIPASVARVELNGLHSVEHEFVRDCIKSAFESPGRSFVLDVSRLIQPCSDSSVQQDLVAFAASVQRAPDNAVTLCVVNDDREDEESDDVEEESNKKPRLFF